MLDQTSSHLGPATGQHASACLAYAVQSELCQNKITFQLCPYVQYHSLLTMECLFGSV